MRLREALDSARWTEGSKLEFVCSFDICAYRTADGAWNADLEYSDEEVSQGERTKSTGRL